MCVAGRQGINVYLPALAHAPLTSICRGFVVQQAVRQIHNITKGYSTVTHLLRISSYVVKKMYKHSLELGLCYVRNENKVRFIRATPYSNFETVLKSLDNSIMVFAQYV